MNRNLLAISIKHTHHKWKFGMPCILWGRRTEDHEERSFGGYTENPYNAELYTLKEWQEKNKVAWIKTDEPVKMEINFCKKWREYDTVLINYDDYIKYCDVCGFDFKEV